jgi:hypothetical protein
MYPRAYSQCFQLCSWSLQVIPASWSAFIGVYLMLPAYLQAVPGNHRLVICICRLVANTDWCSVIQPLASTMVKHTVGNRSDNCEILPTASSDRKPFYWCSNLTLFCFHCLWDYQWASRSRCSWKLWWHQLCYWRPYQSEIFRLQAD